MAQMQENENRSKRNRGTRATKLSTRVDLTPMVDLGFLLITFFIFTTSLSEPKAMQLILPADATKDPSTVAQSKVITLIPVEGNKIFYYEDDESKQMQVTNFGAEGIRKILLSKKKAVAKQFGDGQEITVLIKPAETSNYENLVDVLDEMLINNIDKYMIVDLDTAERQIIGMK